MHDPGNSNASAMRSLQSGTKYAINMMALEPNNIKYVMETFFDTNQGLLRIDELI